MKQFEYANLMEQVNHGCWLWYLDGRILNPSRVMGTGFEYYEELSYIEVLNIVGKDSWQVANVKIGGTNTNHNVLLMREVD
jgi:hypothetical protein